MAIAWNAVGLFIGSALTTGLMLGAMVRGWRVYRADRPLVDKLAYTRQPPFPHNLFFGRMVHAVIQHQDDPKGEIAQVGMVMMGMVGGLFLLSGSAAASVLVRQNSVEGAIGLAVHGLMAVWIGRQGRDFRTFEALDRELPRSPLQDAFDFTASDLAANQRGVWSKRQLQQRQRAHQRANREATVIFGLWGVGMVVFTGLLLRGEWWSVVPLVVLALQISYLPKFVRDMRGEHRFDPQAAIIKVEGVRKDMLEPATEVFHDVTYEVYALTDVGVKVVVFSNRYAALKDEVAYTFYCEMEGDHLATVLSVEVGVG